MVTRSEPTAQGLEGHLSAAREAERSGDWTQAIERYEAAFWVAGKGDDACRCAEILRWIGTVHRERGDLELAQEVYEASLAIAEASCADQVAPVLNAMAAIEQFDGRPQVAEDLYRQAKQLAEESGDHRLVSIVDQNLGALANIRGDIASAIESYRSAAARARATGDDRTTIAALNNMGMAYVDVEQLDHAARCFDEAHELARLALDSFSIGYVQLNRAELYLKQQRYEEARQSCDDGFSIFNRLESKTGLGEAYKFYGVLYRDTGKPHLADVHLGLALDLAQYAQNRLLQAEIQHEFARLHQEERRSLDAIRSLNEAYRLFQDMQAARELLEIEQQLYDLERSYLRVVESWGTDTIHSKDPYTLDHSRRVADLTRRMGEVVGIAGHELIWLQVGAFLHDVGKTVVPPGVLSKPGALSDDEWDIMKRHTVVGEQIVGGLHLPRSVSPLIRSHHERWDGRGYPDRLAGEAIPFEARLLAVADSYDALTSARSYRQAFEPAMAMQIMREQSGRAYDPDMVDVFDREIWQPMHA